ncbi:MAG: LAGLIDADG family homing endonuclease [Candidatus Wildermuthbacteria bacterium]|nr:LAGLIDADG family homing endonuclease [Candidatus Wildermuthbacteria bacterium]
MPAQRLPDKDFDWTPSLAYVLGLLATDGCLSKDGRHIIMRSSDIQLLDTFKKCLNISSKITETFNNGFAKKPSYRIQPSMVQFYRWLLRIGLFPAKTYTIGAIAVPDEYFRDFLRGHLDGDGSIMGYTDSYNAYKNPKYVYTRIWLKFISASAKHIKWLQSRILQTTGRAGHILEDKSTRPSKTTNMWILKFGKEDSINLLNWIYYDTNLPCLQRKRKKAEELLQKERVYWAKTLPSHSAGRPRVRSI